METILSVRDLNVAFHTYAGTVQAVRGVSFDLKKGETLAIVGESGSGNSVTSKAIMRLIPNPPGEITKGEILFEGRDLVKLSDKEMQKVRRRDFAMIFQDPMTSLNPTMTIYKQIAEGLKRHQGLTGDAARKRTLELLTLVGIPTQARLNQYPHQLSGGMRQRIVIAIALACNPKVLIADEPTTARVVTSQAQMLELLKAMQQETGTAIIFITHDLGVVANMTDREAVMYAGKLIEKGTVDEIFYEPRHPYTWGLLGSMPRPSDDRSQDLPATPGTPPNLLHPPVGAAFAPRNK
jgi:oligopeptide transport system ATP-binding protein